MSSTSFRPTSHGWPFKNPPPGLCGGMIMSALDYFYAGFFIPPDLDQLTPASPLYGMIYGRQLDSMTPGTVLKFFQWQCLRPDTGSAGNPYHSIGHLVQTEEWPAARAELDANRPVPLGLIRAESDDPGSVTDNHQVLAYRYELLSGNVVRIWIYDSNYPINNSVYVQFTLGQAASRLDALQSTGEPLRGFFVIPYDRAATDRRIQGCWFNRLAYSRVVNHYGVRIYEYLAGFGWAGNTSVDYSLRCVTDLFPDERCLLAPGGKAHDRVRCPESTGTRNVTAAFNQNYGAWFDVRFYLQDRMFHADRLVLPRPYVYAVPFLREAPPRVTGGADPGCGISDVRMADVVVVKEKASEREARVYADRSVEVEGEPLYDGCRPGDQGVVPAGMRVEWKMGYVASPIFCAVHEGYLDANRALWYRRTRRRAQDDSGTTDQGPIGDADHDRFPVCGGFTRAAYDDDMAVEMKISASELEIGEVASDTDMFYGKSLLVVGRMVMSRFAGPGRFIGVKQRVREYIDKRLLKDLIAELGPAPGPGPWPVDAKMRSAILTAAKTAWRRLQADRETAACLAAIYRRELQAAEPVIRKSAREAVGRAALRRLDAGTLQRANGLAEAYLRCCLVRRLLSAKSLSGLARLKRKAKRPRR